MASSTLSATSECSSSSSGGGGSGGGAGQLTKHGSPKEQPTASPSAVGYAIQQQQQQQQSPRNTLNNSSSTIGYVHFGAVDVPKAMQDGEKFIKWDEDSGVGTPVTCRVDPKGFYLYWVDQNNEMDLLDIATIRDVRTAQYAKKPRDTKLRQIVTMGSQDTLEEKTVTVCYGSDFVNVNFVNFCCTRKDIAQTWSDVLIRLAYSLRQLNGSSTMFLQKAHTKLCLQVDKTGKIPVKNIIKQIAQNKDDRRRVEKALDVSGLPSGKSDVLPLTKFQFEDFFNLYKNLTQRAEVEKIFDELVGTAKRRLMSTSQLVDFLNKTQRDPRLNEILYPYANPARAKDIIHEYEPNKFNAQKGQLSFDGFLRYLMSEDNPIMAPNQLELCDDMDQPMAHYFINSSHNTYLTGHQLTGKSSVEIYRQALLAGCRCVELDFWNGRTEEPVIVHGYTFVPEIYAKDVLEAIAESAFKTSDFPVILSFENHCNPRQQAKIANYCRDIFGDMLLDKPLDSHPLESSVDLPPPAMLRRKIIIKNKKKHHHHHHHKKVTAQASVPNVTPNITLNSGNSSNAQEDGLPTGNGDVPHHAPPLQQIRQSSKDSTGSSDTDSSSDDESIPGPPPGATDIVAPDKVQQTKETEAGAEISALVNYVQPVHFSSFENAEKKGRFYEMSSFDEKQATTLLKERPIEFVNYNKHQLSRVYPAGTRFDSSNFMPQLFWNAGCQLVALNYQTLDLSMQLNLGIFEYNHRSGYLLKPEFMRRNDRRLDPFAESTVDGIIAGTVSITVLSGQFLTDKKVGCYVEVDMYGLPADTVRKKFRTKIVRDNSINPVFDEEPFVFKKVVLPELASLRIAAYEEGGRFIGHRVLPVIGLCPGYRHLTLRNEVGQPVPLATLFLCIVVKDYVPDGLSDFAEALANPIKYQSELEKRAQQLAVLTEDMEPSVDEDASNACSKKDLKSGFDTLTGSPKHRSSIVASTSTNVENSATNVTVDVENSGASGTHTMMIHQQSVEQSSSNVIKSIDTIDSNQIRGESLEKILEHKSIREKRNEMEKKLDALRKKHDKEKIRIAATKDDDDTIKIPTFCMGNRLIKRLSSKTIDMPTQVPPCMTEIGETSEDSTSPPGITRSQSERLIAVCREYSNAYRDIQEKYHEMIYATAEKVLKNSQANQMKQLKTFLERETNEVMRQLQLKRRNEVKELAQVHRDRDELIRMKREVASSLVERGVSERVRLTQAYDKRRDELQRQHDLVKSNLDDHKAKTYAMLEKDLESRHCISSSGFLPLFDNPSLANAKTTELSNLQSTTTSTSITLTTTTTTSSSATTATSNLVKNTNNSTTTTTTTTTTVQMEL